LFHENYMTKRKKIILWGLGLFSVLLLVVWLSLSFLIESEILKEKIQAAAIQKNVGEIDYHKSFVVLLPRPHLTLEKIRFSDPERALASVASIEVYPDLLPLFRGQLRISEIFLKRPGVKVKLPDEPLQPDEATKPDGPLITDDSVKGVPASITAGRLSDMIVRLSRFATDLTVSIEQGQFELYESGQQKIFVKNLNLDADIVLTPTGSCDAEIDISGPSIIVSQAGKNVEIDCDRLKAVANVNKNKADIYLTKMRLGQPALNLTGRFTASPESTGYNLDLNGKDLDVDAIRTAALDLGGDVEVVKDIFSYIQGGCIPVVRIQSKSKLFSELWDLDNLIIRGQMEGGDISIDDLGIQLTEVNGDALITRGILTATKAGARLGETAGHDGLFKIGLAEGSDVFDLDIILNAQLRQVPGVLNKIIDYELFNHELSMINNLEGKAKARLVLGGSLENISTNLEVTEVALSADYQRIPFPIEIRSGRIIFSGNLLKWSGLNGRAGDSIVYDTSGVVDWANGVFIDLSAGTLALDLGEFFPWMESIGSFQDDLADLKSAEGIFELSALEVKIPHDSVNKNDPWQISAAGKVRQVCIDIGQLPETIYLPSGEIRFAQDQLSFQDLVLQMMDSGFSLTGTMEGPVRQPDCAAVFLEGNLGENFIRFLTQSDYIPSEYAVSAPVQFAETHISWQEPDILSFKGNICFPKGAMVLADLKHHGDALKVKHLDVKDQYSAAVMSLDLEEDRVGMVFTGKLQSRTLDQIFLAEKWSDGWLKGDLQVDFVRGRPSESTIKGQLEGENLMVPVNETAPLLIEKFLLSADNKRINVETLSLSYLNNQVGLTGHVDMTADTFLLDLEASAGDLKWESSPKNLEASTDAPVDNTKSDFWEYPVAGNINLSAKSFSFGRYTWKPLLSKISREQGAVKIEVVEANLCGIDTPGTLQLDSETLDLDFQFSAGDKDFITTYECLSKNQIEMNGRYELNGQVKYHGPIGGLSRSFHGGFEFNARDGVITKDKKLSRVLEVVNFTEIVKGKIPDLKTHGFNYKTINVKGKFADNRIVLDSLFMDGKTLDLYGTGTYDLDRNTFDVKLLAAPFKSVDSVVKSIPGVNYLMAGNLVSIPVSINGDVANPVVNIMSAEDISSSFLKFAERAIHSPIQLMNNLSPYYKFGSE